MERKTKNSQPDQLLYAGNEISFVLRATRHGQKPLLIYPAASAIVPVEDWPLTENSFIWLIEQYRLGCDCLSLEIPAGKAKASESPLDCARRELREECGLEASHWQPLLEYFPAIGLLTERLHLFLASGLKSGPAQPDDDEELTLHKVSLAQMGQLVESGQIADAKTILAYYLLKSRL